MKTLYFLDEQHTAERIIKTETDVVGYVDNEIVFRFSGVTDFSIFTLADGQTFDKMPVSDHERIEQLENMIIMMMEVM